MTSLFDQLKLMASPSGLKKVWPVLRSVPGGGRVMGRLIGRMARYTGTIRPEFLTLEPGYAKVRMADTPRVRNHLNSVHAIALLNLGEATTGVAVLYTLPDDARGIVTGLSMEYLKKARGPITAECRCEFPVTNQRREFEVHGDLRNEAGELVARAHAKWLVGPAR